MGIEGGDYGAPPSRSERLVLLPGGRFSKYHKADHDRRDTHFPSGRPSTRTSRLFTSQMYQFQPVFLAKNSVYIS